MESVASLCLLLTKYIGPKRRWLVTMGLIPWGRDESEYWCLPCENYLWNHWWSWQPTRILSLNYEAKEAKRRVKLGTTWKLSLKPSMVTEAQYNLKLEIQKWERQRGWNLGAAIKLSSKPIHGHESPVQSEAWSTKAKEARTRELTKVHGS